MPLYEYECQVCGERFERIQRVDAEPVTSCPSCGGAVHRLMGVPALQFKGSGWYVTDYAKGNGRSSSNESTEKASSVEESSSEASNSKAGDGTTKPS